MVHSAEDGSIPVPDNLNVIAELQAVALAIRLVGLDNLDRVIVRNGYEAAGEVSPNLKAKAQGEGG